MYSKSEYLPGASTILASGVFLCDVHGWYFDTLVPLASNMPTAVAVKIQLLAQLWTTVVRPCRIILQPTLLGSFVWLML